MYSQQEKENWHYEKLVGQWGPPQAAMRLAEMRTKTPEDLAQWEESCRGRANYALSRASGDGFWEAKLKWYGERANWIRDFNKEQHWDAPRNSPKRIREEAIPTVPMKILRRSTQNSPRQASFEVTPGGWPSGKELNQSGPTPSGLHTGNLEDTSSPPVPLSPTPSGVEQPSSLDLIKEYV